MPARHALPLAWLAQFVRAREGTMHGWSAAKEFLAEECGGGWDVALTTALCDARRRTQGAASASCARAQA